MISVGYLNKNKSNDKIKLLYVTPHLSTGGMPQFLLKRIQELQKHKDEVEIFLVEFCLFSGTYIVQRNQIINLIDENHFFNLSIIGEEKEVYFGSMITIFGIRKNLGIS